MVCALFGFMACTQNPIEEQSAIRTDAPETIRVGFEDDETRIQLNEAQKTVWTKDDQVSVFYKSDANQKWEHRGETGERVAELYCVDAGTASSKMNYVVLVYPYSTDYVLSTASGNIEATLPATQHYAEGSYGVGNNLMVSQSEFTQFSLKSVCGWLKLQLTGDGEVVKSIKFRGNDGEQVAGLIYVDTATAEATLATEMGSSDDNNAGGNLVFDDTILTEVVLDCCEGVTLGAEATSFYISLPPQTFANGFTVEIEDTDGYAMEQSTAKTFVVERNTISPMAALEFVNPNRPTQPTPANNEIWYTNGSTTEATTPYETGVFGANIVSNTYDAAKECWIITFDGKVTTIGERAFYSCSSLTSVAIPDSVTSIGELAFYYCSSLTSVTIPDSVTTIGNSAFYDCYKLTSVTIGDRVTTIGESAFSWCESLTSVTIGDSVTTIGESAFEDCSSLTSVTIPDSVTTIGSSAFNSCSSLTSVTIPDSVTTIGGHTFCGCYSLTSVTIPDSVTTIGDGAFSDCYSLTSVIIPDSVTEIGESAFTVCSSLTSVTIGNGVTSIGDYAFVNCESLTSVTIPDSVTTIGEEAFRDCYSLTSVTIGDSVTTIGNYAFSGCSSLTSAVIGDGVTTIGERVFYNCSSLTSVTIPDSVTTIGNYAFYECSSLTSVTIPDSVTTIGSSAFSWCESLTSVTIPNSVTTIGNSAFRCCSSLQEFKSKFASEDGRCLIIDGALNSFAPAGLTEYTIPDSVTTIGYKLFSGCSSLTSVTIPDSVTAIGYAAFAYCDRLTSVTIGDSVTLIGYDAFSYCSSLTSVYCKAITPPAGDYSMFYDNASGRKIYVPMESVEAYKSAYRWREYADDIVGYNFENGAAGTPKPANNEIWYTNGSTTTATTPCQTGAFGSAKIQSNTYNNTLKKWVIKFDEDVTKIDNDAFSFIENITSITIPDSVTSISGNAFADCPNLEKFIGKFAEDNGCCIVIDNTIIEYAEGSGDEYKIPNDVTKIGDYALSWCENLKSIIIPNSVTEVGDYAFAYCSSLTSATIGNRVTVIKSSAFYNCSSLQSINIPNSVTKIEVLAFQNCTNLTEVYCSALTPPTGGSGMFKNNASGRKIYVPMESVEAYKSASYWSDYASDIVGYNF